MKSSTSSYNSLLHSSILHDKNSYSNTNDFLQPSKSIYRREDLSFQTLQEKVPFKPNDNTGIQFQGNRIYLNKEIYLDYNKSFRDWFFSPFSQKMQQLFKTIYYN